jgi:hypothetical protein
MLFDSVIGVCPVFVLKTAGLRQSLYHSDDDDDGLRMFKTSNEDRFGIAVQ